MRSTGLVPPGRAFIEKRMKQMAGEIADECEVFEEAARAATPVSAEVASVSCGLDRFSVRMSEPAPDDAALETLNEEFADIIARGRIERIAATPAEEADDDHLDLERVAFRFDRHGFARLRALIDRLNGREPAR